MPRVPNTASTLFMFVAVISTISRMRLRFEFLSSTGFVRAAATASRAVPTSPPAGGSDVEQNSERAIFAGLTETPGSNPAGGAADRRP